MFEVLSLESLLRHIPAARREMVKKAIINEEYLAPAVCTMPMEEIEELLMAAGDETDEVPIVLH
jgi:hypothetical protein